MTTGDWRLGLGHTIVLRPDAGTEREVSTASGEPPTRSGVAQRIAGNWARYSEDQSGTVTCYDAFGKIAWQSRSGMVQTVIAEPSLSSVHSPLVTAEEVVDPEPDVAPADSQNDAEEDGCGDI